VRSTSVARRRPASRSPAAPSVATAATPSPTASRAPRRQRRRRRRSNRDRGATLTLPALRAGSLPRMTKVRFAPSPTGRLHLGNARTALVNWLFARKSGGRFLLRLDDTDRERSREDFAAAIETDLKWLGLDWDEFERQSARLDRYAAAAERMKAAGLLYPCFESAEELDLKRRLAQQRGQPWIYDRAALSLSKEEIARRTAAGESPHWRFKLAHSTTAWDDLVRGPTEFQGAHLGDRVLVRADGMPLYTFSSVVDDAELGITHVIRGEDHVTNTAFQIQIFEALGATVPAFAHLSLITGKGGEALSKRMASLSLAML